MNILLHCIVLCCMAFPVLRAFNFRILFNTSFVPPSLIFPTDIKSYNAKNHSFDIKPEHYIIRIRIDDEKNTFFGICNIDFTVHNKIDFIAISSANLSISLMELYEKFGAEDRSGRKIEYETFSLPEKETYNLKFKTALTPGNYMLVIKFNGTISNEKSGLFKIPYKNEDGNIRWFIGTHNWFGGIRRVFPCFDYPEMRAKFSIVIEHSRKYVAISNMRHKKITRNNNIVQTQFAQTPDIPTYFVTLMLYDKSTTVSKSAGLRVRNQTASDLTFAKDIIFNITSYFKNTYNISNIRLKHFAIPGLIDDNMMWGLFFYREDDIMFNKKLDPISRKLQISRLIGRKIGQQLLSFKTSPSDWNYFWLNDGIATVLFGSDVIDKIFQNCFMSNLFFMQIHQESLYMDDRNVMNSFISLLEKDRKFNFDFASSFFSYVKAPAIIRMIQHVYTDEIFRKGIDLYFKRKSASLSDFFADMKRYFDEIFEKSLLRKYKLNITEIMYQYIEQESYPIINVRQERDENSTHKYVIKEISNIWQIFINLALSKDWNTVHDIIIPKSYNFNINIPEDMKIILNINQTGYYRVNYEPKVLGKLENYLKSENYTNIYVLNRAQIIDDAFYFTMMGQLNASTFWNLISYLSKETEYIAWYPMFKIIERISYIFPFQESGQNVKIILKELLQSLLQKIGYDENSHENYLIKCLRQEAVKWACLLNHDYCMQTAFMKLYLHSQNPKRYPLLPEWKYWAHCNGFKYAYMSELGKMHFNKSYENKNMLEYLACSRNFYVNFITEENYTLHILSAISKNNIDKINFFHYNVARHARKSTILDYILINWKKIIPKEIPTITAIVDIINHVYSSESLIKTLIFLKINTPNKTEDQINSLYIKCNFKSVEVYEIKLLNAIFEIIKNFDNNMFFAIKKKIDLRLSQIENQTKSFRF